MPAKAKRHNPFSKPVRRHQPDVRQRESAAQRGYDTRWRKERLRWLHENPLCRPCDKRGRVKAAQEVDHIIPHNGDHALFWDRGNWQSICRECHEEKSARERRKGTRASVTPRWLPSPNKLLMVVCGPPSAGKTTYVREQAGEDDLVLDLDVLAEAIGKPLDAMSVEERSQAIRERNSRLAAFCEGRTHHPRC